VGLNEYSALRYCGSEFVVRIPEGIERIDECCFVSLECITVKGLGRFSSRDYFDWARLKAITIPSSVTSLGGRCFNRCR
jgi:hypothetical protein